MDWRHFHPYFYIDNIYIDESNLIDNEDRCFIGYINNEEIDSLDDINDLLGQWIRKHIEE